jgi:hypothetical protein
MDFATALENARIAALKSTRAPHMLPPTDPIRLLDELVETADDAIGCDGNCDAARFAREELEDADRKIDDMSCDLADLRDVVQRIAKAAGFDANPLHDLNGLVDAIKALKAKADAGGAP